MLRRAEVGCCALNDHGNYIIDHGKIMEKSWNFVFEFLWEPWLVHMRQTVSFRIISARLHVKGQPLYGRLTLRYGIWKTIKRKINSQVKIKQIVKLNDINVTIISD